MDDDFKKLVLCILKDMDEENALSLTVIPETRMRAVIAKMAAYMRIMRQFGDIYWSGELERHVLNMGEKGALYYHYEQDENM
jgi:hypothetical protein